MQTNNHKINDYSAVLDQKYGAPGSAERAAFDDEAYTFYTSQLLREARIEAGVTQSELAERVNTSKSYISRLEHGDTTPSAALFFRIISALGLEVLFHRQLSNIIV